MHHQQVSSREQGAGGEEQGWAQTVSVHAHGAWCHAGRSAVLSAHGPWCTVPSRALSSVQFTLASSVASLISPAASSTSVCRAQQVPPSAGC